jgi:hypothetical protein
VMVGGWGGMGDGGYTVLYVPVVLGLFLLNFSLCSRGVAWLSGPFGGIFHQISAPANRKKGLYSSCPLKNQGTR